MILHFLKRLGDGKEIDMDILQINKRKKEIKEEHLAKEQMKEMKKLESFLFGSLYSPVEFGTGDDEEARNGAAKDSALFFTDQCCK
ncbi:U3 small nucleolar RNA-associated protein 18-like [Quillaja saponaria]|uniref:U3 small nucleolar RNA-associated protein 18-like n=1 Tax=Quillaja saponaria TaxID=32244 RepID=A0AAD7M1U5_QUISA|nr:U3 small nucleolar RNA-associated protein 18-like [Quillaja saponaria]